MKIHMKLLTTLLLALLTVSAMAEGDGEIWYKGGTLAALAEGASGKVDSSGPAELVLRFDGTGSQAVRNVSIPYRQIVAFHYTDAVAHKLGVLPTILVGIIAARIHRHTFSINYTDQAGVLQVVQFDTASDVPNGLLEVLRARASQACGGANEYHCSKSSE